MILLRLLWLVVFAILLAGVVTQIIQPAIKGRKLFPAFRTDELRDRVETTRDEVESLRDQNKNLSELGVLLKEKATLEAEIATVDKPNQGKQ